MINSYVKSIGTRNEMTKTITYIKVLGDDMTDTQYDVYANGAKTDYAIQAGGGYDVFKWIEAGDHLEMTWHGHHATLKAAKAKVEGIING